MQKYNKISITFHFNSFKCVFTNIFLDGLMFMFSSTVWVPLNCSIFRAPYREQMKTGTEILWKYMYLQTERKHLKPEATLKFLL